MTSQYRHRRTSNPATVFPNPIEPGEITVNTANRQIAVGDAASATLGAPKPLLPIRYFDIAAQYVTNDFVVNGNSLYRANKATGPGAFTAADWVMMVGQTDPQYVEIAGDVMTGSLSLPAAAPTAGVHATNKTYVDNLVATKSSVVVSDVPPTPVPVDGTLWYNTLDGQMYIRYNDGNSTQWVIAAPQPDIGQFVNKTGDTMTGNLTISRSYAQLALDDTGAGVASDVVFKKNGKTRWLLRQESTTPESGGNVGSDLQILRFDDAGAFIQPGTLNISRATNTIDFAKKPTVAGAAWAAPMDALAYNGMQINGGMEVSQQFGQSGNGATNSYSVDGWIMAYAGTGTGIIFGAQYNWGMNGFPSILAFSVATAQAVMGANDLFYCRHAIEGLRSARLGWGTANAQPITIGFWTSHNRTGTWSGAISNGAANRCYAFTYTQTASNVMEYHTVTIPGDTTGTWAVDNTKGLLVIFAIAAGSAFTAPSANAWLAGNYVAAPGQVNGVALTTDVFRITGVVVLPGIEAPSAARSPFIMRPFDQELMTCQRYYEKTYPAGDSPGKAYGTAQGGAPLGSSLTATASYQSVPWRYQVRKRSAPTAVCYSPFTGAAGKFSSNNTPTDVNAAIASAGDMGCLIYVNGVSVSAADFVFAHATADARL